MEGKRLALAAAAGILAATSVHAQAPANAQARFEQACEKAFWVSGNFARDLYGAADTREHTWGRAEASVHTVTFTPPPGKRVRVLAVRGDLVSWIGGASGANAPAGSAVGVLFGMSTTAPDGGNGVCDYCATNTFHYVQDALTPMQPKARTGFDYAHVDTLLERDNRLVMKVAAWLNTTGAAIHMEGTYSIQVRWEVDNGQ